MERAERKRVQELLKLEQKKVEKELASKRQQQEQQAKRDAEPSAASKASYTVKITNYGKELLFTVTCDSVTVKCLPELKNGFANCSYSHIFAAWDQSDKFVKIYLNLKNVHTIPSENVEVSFSER